MLLGRDETRTAYILQGVDSAWEGVDRRKKTAHNLPLPETMAPGLPSNTEGLETLREENHTEVSLQGVLLALTCCELGNKVVGELPTLAM